MFFLRSLNFDEIAIVHSVCNLNFCVTQDRLCESVEDLKFPLVDVGPIFLFVSIEVDCTVLYPKHKKSAKSSRLSLAGTREVYGLNGLINGKL